METISKQSDTEIKITTPVEEIVSITTLKEDYTKAVNSLAEFEAWVLEERKARQKIIDGTLDKINQAKSLGVSDVQAIDVGL